MTDETEPSPPRDARPQAGDVLWLRLAGALSALLAASGVALLFVFQPGPEALRSLIDLREASPAAALRDVHHWASHGLLIVGFLAVSRAFVLGEDRAKRRWVAGVALYALAIVAALTGWLLPGRAGEPLAIYAAHSVVVPLAASLIVLAYRRRRPRTGAPTGAPSS